MTVPANVNPEADKNIKLVDKYNTSNRQKHVTQMAMDKDFHLGKQWTKEEVAQLEEIGHYPLVIPRIYPIIQQKKAQLTAKLPSFRCVPAEDGDVQVAHLLSNIMTYVWNISNGKGILKRSLDDALVKGLGYMYTYIDKFADFGRGEVKVGYLPPEDVFVDPDSHDPVFDDAENLIIYKELTKAQVKRIAPNIDFTKMQAQGDNQYLVQSDLSTKYEDIIQPADRDSDAKLYRWYERYTKVKKINYVVQDEKGGLQTYSEDEFQQAKNQLTGEELQLLEEKAGRTYLDRVDVVITCENQLVNKYTLPISYYPIVPLCNIFIGTPYPLSDVRMLRGLQKEVNKRRSLMIAHAIVSTNPRLILEEGSVKDEDEVEKRWNTPYCVVKYLPGAQAPQTHPPLALPSALYQLEAEAKYDMEYTAGVFALQQGDPESAPDTFRGTMAIEEFGNRRIALTADMVNDALAQLGKVVVELVQSNYTIQKTFRIAQPDGEMTEFQVNYMDDYSKAGKKINDITVGQYDVYYVAGSTMASNRWAMLDELVKLYNLGIIDDIEVLKKTEIFDTPKLIERKSMLAQTMNQNKEMQDAVKKLMQEVESLRKKNVTLEKEVEIQKFKLDLQRQLDELGLTEDTNKAMRLLEKKELQLAKQRTQKNQKDKSK